MPDTLIIGGQTYTNVTGIKATDINDVIQTFSKGGGGASNIVTGTFKGTNTGAAMDVNIPYSGSGYPLVVIIYASDGLTTPSTTFGDLIASGPRGYFSAIKRDFSSAPTYPSSSSNSEERNKYAFTYVYKNSTTSAANYSTSGTSSFTAAVNLNASSSGSYYFRIKDSKTLSVYISNTIFVPNVDYTYYIIYSS